MRARTGRLLLETLRLRTEGPVPGTRDAWARVDARVVTDAVRWEGGAQWLFRRLWDLDLTDAAPVPLAATLRRVAADERARGLLVDAQAEDVVSYLDARGVPHVLIKGSARRASAARYPYADARATRDVDVLLPAARVPEVWGSLRRHGWPLAADPALTPPDHYHPPPLLGPHRVAVELHASTGRGITPEEAWHRARAGAQGVAWHGLVVQVPSATELLWHGLTHALGEGAAGFRLRHLLDGAAILAAAAAVDWDALGARLGAGAEADPDAARDWLGAAADLAGRDLPTALRPPAGGFDLARALAWRLAVFARGGDEGFTGRLLEEGTRAELGYPVAPVVAGTGAFRQARRWVAGRAARGAYRAWKVAS